MLITLKRSDYEKFVYRPQTNKCVCNNKKIEEERGTHDMHTFDLSEVN